MRRTFDPSQAAGSELFCVDYQPGQFMLNPEVVVTVVARQFTRVPIWEV
jgi:hypothetical protein